MNCSCVHSGGLAASRTRLYMTVLRGCPVEAGPAGSVASGRVGSGEADLVRPADQQALQTSVAVHPARGDEARLGHSRAPHLAEEELVLAEGGRGQEVVGAGALLALFEVADEGGTVPGEVGRVAVAGGEQDGEGEVVADQVEDPGRFVTVEDVEPGREEGGGGGGGIGHVGSREGVGGCRRAARLVRPVDEVVG